MQKGCIVAHVRGKQTRTFKHMSMSCVQVLLFVCKTFFALLKKAQKGFFLLLCPYCNVLLLIAFLSSPFRRSEADKKILVLHTNF